MGKQVKINMEQVLTVTEVAQRLRVNVKTVYRMLEKGRLHGVRVGRLWRVPDEALSEYLQSGKEGIQTLREYTCHEISEFLKADRISPEITRKLEQLLTQ
jgi:excisionase family DNA binding protein